MSENQFTSIEDANQNKVSHTPMELSSAEIAIDLDGHEMQKKDRSRTGAETKDTASIEEDNHHVVLTTLKMNESQITSVEDEIQNKIYNTSVELSSAEIAINMDGHEMQKENRSGTSAEKEDTACMEDTASIKDTANIKDTASIEDPASTEEKIGPVIIDILKDSKKYENLNVWEGHKISQVYWAQPGNPQQGYRQPPPEANRDYMTMQYSADHVYVPYDPKTRNGFVRLVFIMLLFMLLVTAGLVIMFLSVEPLTDFLRALSLWTVIILLIGILFISITMSFYPYARRMPCNIILLIITVLLFTLLCARICVHYDTNVIFMALLITAAVVVACLLLACTKFDFTSYLLYVIGISFALSLVGVLILVLQIAFKIRIKGVIIAFLVIVVLVQVVTLIIQLQMVLGGKTVELEENDYALAAFLLYSSVVHIFITILQLLD